jgi:hypothetical protein
MQAVAQSLECAVRAMHFPQALRDATGVPCAGLYAIFDNGEVHTMGDLAPHHRPAFLAAITVLQASLWHALTPEEQALWRRVRITVYLDPDEADVLVEER